MVRVHASQPKVRLRSGARLATTVRASLRPNLLTCAAALLLTWPLSCGAYAVLTHEAIIDVVWKTHLRSLLVQRFPAASNDELRTAHAHAYGGAIIQDLGYYPYGSRFFSDLTHYIRSGDFVEALLRDSRDLNEYAFALGAMAHYVADNEGHRLAVNRAVPLLYPNLKKKYGDVVTYEDSPLAHLKTEFGFDVLEVAKERYAPDAYHDFIGFAVAQSLLDRAFQETYGLKLSDVLVDETRAIASYRRDVSKLIPKATKVAWEVKEDEIKNDLPGMTRDRFLFNLSKASYEKRWGGDYRKPNFVEKFLAFLFHLVPKIGPLKVLTLRTPTPETERRFEASFNTTLDQYRELLTELGTAGASLPNDNLDVGTETPPGKYRLNDETYAELLHRLATDDFSHTTTELRSEIVRFYAVPGAANGTQRSSGRWSRVQSELAQLKQAELSSSRIRSTPSTP